MALPTKRAGRFGLVVCGWGVLTLSGSVPANASVPARPSAVPDGPERQLSNETTLTSWANPAANLKVRRSPRSDAATIIRLHPRTEDGYSEVYLLLRRWIDPNGKAWIQVRVPMRPNGRTGWVPATGLGPMRTVSTQLVIDRRRLRATLYRAGRRIWRSPVGIGKPSTPTPAGRFWIRERIRVSTSTGLYGPWAFGTSGYSVLSDWPGGGVVGIHGTNEPGLIPGRPSHGCVRVPNSAITRLARLMPIGTPVRIR